MIITCINCAKKFDIDSSLIPEKGRLLQCNDCKYKWFFKKKKLNEPVAPAIITKPTEKIALFNDELDLIEIKNSKSKQLSNKKINHDTVIKKISPNKKKIEKVTEDQKNIIIKNKKKYNLLNLILVLIISFITLIIFLDTFKELIGKYIPNFEFILYSLYETIKDIRLFMSDLI
jgi:predicted Zn finger-like uncharacterized protein